MVLLYTSVVHLILSVTRISHSHSIGHTLSACTLGSHTLNSHTLGSYTFGTHTRTFLTPTIASTNIMSGLCKFWIFKEESLRLVSMGEVSL